MLGKWTTAVRQMDDGRWTNGRRTLDKWTTDVRQIELL